MTCTSRLLRNLLLGALLLGMPLVQAGEVTSLAASGSGSLRDVVAGGGTVTFASGLSGTIDLAGSSITVPGGTTIQGPGARSLAVQGGSGRAFVVSAGSTVSISGLTISASNAGAGQTGGAINNAGALTLADMVFASNSAGDAGGAVFNSGQLVIRRSLFNANQITDTTCASGGAVRSQGAGSSLTIENSTFTGNSAPSCSGGGVGFNNGGATITSSTFTANSAGASGGNLYKGSNAAPLTLTATVIADGSAPTNADLHGAMGGFTSGGYNLVRARGDSTGYVGSDLANGTDPALGALGDHGGPSNSRLPQAGSPLLDAFTSGCTGTDQRGVARPQGASCDIGAVEYRLDPLTVQITGNGTVSAGATPAPVSGSIANCAGTCTATYDGEGATPASVTLTATPGVGYQLSGWGGACSGSSPSTVVAMGAARTCTASFELTVATITPSVIGGHGTISPDTPQQVNIGDTLQFTLTPETNYHVASVGGSCGGTLNGNVYTTAAVNADCSVEAHFAIDQHTVTPSVIGGHGTISPDTAQQVDHGATIQLTLAADPHYHLVNVDGSCDGSLNGNLYTTAAVTGDCTVQAHFAIDTYTIGGTVSGLIGSALVLKLNGGQDLLISSNGSFTFASAIDDLSAWTVTVAQQPVSPTQRCTVSNGSGTLDGANVNNVQVQCETPVPHLVVSVTDSREYARYGMLLDYVVTLTNDGSGDATGITVQGLPSDQLDATAMSWVCYGADASAHCSASGSGAFSDTAVDLPIGRTLTWLVSAPVRNDAPGPSADFTIEAGMGASASDSDILVLLRTGFDVPYGDGAERAGEGSACHAPLVGSAVLGASSTYAFELPAAASTPIDVVLVARAVDGSGFRVERLNLGSPRLRLVASTRDGIETASAWSAPKAESLLLGLASAAGQNAVLLEGVEGGLSIPLVAGSEPAYRISLAGGHCQP